MNLYELLEVTRNFDFKFTPANVVKELKQYDKDIQFTLDESDFYFYLPNIDFECSFHKADNGWYGERDIPGSDEPCSCTSIFDEVEDTIKCREWYQSSEKKEVQKGIIDKLEGGTVINYYDKKIVIMDVLKEYATLSEKVTEESENIIEFRNGDDMIRLGKLINAYKDYNLLVNANDDYKPLSKDELDYIANKCNIETANVYI